MLASILFRICATGWHSAGGSPGKWSEPDTLSKAQFTLFITINILCYLPSCTCHLTCVEQNKIDANIQYLQFLRPLVWRRKTIIGKLQTVCAVWSFPRGWLQKKVMVFIAFFVLIATLPALEKGWKLSVGAMFWKQEFFKGFPLEWLWICICYHYLLDDKWKGAVTPQVLAWHDVQYILLYPRTELFTM